MAPFPIMTRALTGAVFRARDIAEHEFAFDLDRHYQVWAGAVTFKP